MERTKVGDELNRISNNFRSLLEWQGDLGQAFGDHYNRSYEPGIFDTKTKRLMAMCGGIVMGCKGCMLGQAQFAIDAGATAEEILEACSVMISLGGTLAGSKISVIIDLLKEKGMMPESGA